MKIRIIEIRIVMNRNGYEYRDLTKMMYKYKRRKRCFSVFFFFVATRMFKNGSIHI